MELIIDAWLEREHPVLRVRDSRQGRLLLQWDHHELRERLFHGGLCLDDLQDKDLPVWERLGLHPVAVSLPGAASTSRGNAAEDE